MTCCCELVFLRLWKAHSDSPSSSSSSSQSLLQSAAACCVVLCGVGDKTAGRYQNIQAAAKGCRDTHLCCTSCVPLRLLRFIIATLVGDRDSGYTKWTTTARLHTQQVTTCIAAECRQRAACVLLLAHYSHPHIHALHSRPRTDRCFGRSFRRPHTHSAPVAAPHCRLPAHCCSPPTVTAAHSDYQ